MELKEIGSKAFKGEDIELGLDKYEKGIHYPAEYPAPITASTTASKHL